uniref:Uncharacterized protein n=1 Tax=Timema bartmani TaxID=61472 RepID=A0A7R9F5Z5_9NEOP|nr:unnamed protein product [Timema bartmani]
MEKEWKTIHEKSHLVHPTEVDPQFPRNRQPVYCDSSTLNHAAIEAARTETITLVVSATDQPTLIRQQYGTVGVSLALLAALVVHCGQTGQQKMVFERRQSSPERSGNYIITQQLIHGSPLGKSAISSVPSRAGPPNISFSTDRLHEMVMLVASDNDQRSMMKVLILGGELKFGLPKPFDQLGLPSTSTPKSQLGQTLEQSSHNMDESMKDDLITILTKIRDEYKELSENRTKLLEKLGVAHHQLSEDAQKDLLETVQSQMHVFFKCPRYDTQRENLEVIVGKEITPENLGDMMLSSEAAWEATSTFVKEILKGLRHEEQERRKKESEGRSPGHP